MQEINGVKVWGDPVDEGAMRQIENCARLGAADVALMADHHKGYAVPIGGVVAYENQISPSGVGFDIACVAAGSRVTTTDGFTLPVEQVASDIGLSCFDGVQVRDVSAHEGVKCNGTKSVATVRLQNGRAITATPDHLILTASGWKVVAQLNVGDLIACPIFRGVPYEPVDFARLEAAAIAPEVIGLLRDANARGTLAPLARLLGVVSGDGHATRDGKRISVYTTSEADAEAIVLDFSRLGVSPCIGRRNRKVGYKTEIHIYVNSTALHRAFDVLGSPVGRKAWPDAPMPWLGLCPDWVRAQFLSGFASAECTTPRAGAKDIPNLAIKQSRENANAIRFIGSLLISLGFDVSIATSGPERDTRRDWVLQILGGAQAQVRFAETVGFCHGEDKRVASAQVASRFWQHQAIIARRTNAQQEARQRHGANEHWKTVRASVAAKWNVSEGFVYHAMYDQRGTPRCAAVALPMPQTTHAVCWVPVTSVDALAELVTVYDIPTCDDAHSFIAEGVVVHNCGNKAVRLDMPAVEVRKKIKKIMDAVTENLSFGMGRNNKEEVDDELFDDEAWKLLTTSDKQTARNQLGTIGGGNHYVDIFADELDRVWVGVHFGSRGLGHRIATHYLAAGGAKDGMDADPLVLDVNSDLGAQYLEAMNLAGRYAYAGRDWVCGKVSRILKAKIVEEIHNHHNFCVPGDALIPTADGPKPMRDVRSGDQVYTFDEFRGVILTTVADHWCSGAKPILTIKTGNRSLRVSGDHPVLTVEVTTLPHPKRPWFDKGQGALIWKRAEDITVGDALVCAEGYYHAEQSIGLDMARFVGAFLGDGWIRHVGTEMRGYTVGLAIGSGEDCVTARYEALCRRLFPDANWKSNAAGAFGLTCSSVKVYKQIVALEISGYARQKCVPQFVYRLALDEKLAVLSGYFDADGYVANDRMSNSGRGTICSVSLELVQGLRELAIACGLQVTSIRTELRATNFCKSMVHMCVLSAESVGRLELWHERKAAAQRQPLVNRQRLAPGKIGCLTLPSGTFCQRVRSIEVSAEAEVYDLTVEHESHSFICEGVVVHNCWKETHEGRELYVVRKGATPAFPGQKGFVGGSMGDMSVIIEGVDSEESKAALYSTVHGAGRVMSRTAAKGKVKRNGEVIKPGAVTQRMMEAWVIRDKGVELRGGGVDESPHVYKRLPEVLEHHKNSIRILHTLTPLGVAMAGENEHDPYKD